MAASALSMTVLGAGLAMDATAVCVARGVALRGRHRHEALRLASVFGGFQAAMAAGGALFGTLLPASVTRWQDAIAAVVIFAVGAKMLHEGWSKDGDDEPTAELGGRAMVALGVATSLDALAVGVTLPLMGASIAGASLVIGIVTWVFCLAGAEVASRLGEKAPGRLDLLGGVALCGLAAKIAIAHSLG